MKLKELDNDELFVFYAFLDGNEKYNTIKNLKQAILARMNINNLTYLNSILRSFGNE